MNESIAQKIDNADWEKMYIKSAIKVIALEKERDELKEEIGAFTRLVMVQVKEREDIEHELAEAKERIKDLEYLENSWKEENE